jgi:hypothetical protein
MPPSSILAGVRVLPRAERAITDLPLHHWRADGPLAIIYLQGIILVVDLRY